MCFLRFDSRSTGSARLQTDKFALMLDIWNKLVDNSISRCQPGENITIDQQLFPTKSCCRFTKYMPNQPDKFGIKFSLAVDMESKYLLNAIPYLGKNESRPSTSRLSNDVVLTPIESFMCKGRNVTTDNFFTWIFSCQRVGKKKNGLIGTMNKVRRELSSSSKCLQQRYSSKLMGAGNMTTLTVYQCQPKKNVYVLSSLHMSVELGKSDKKKPETVEFYDNSKCDVDVAIVDVDDRMARQYSAKEGTRRCPVAVFYNILDLAGINAFVVYKKANR